MRVPTYTLGEAGFCFFVEATFLSRKAAFLWKYSARRPSEKNACGVCFLTHLCSVGLLRPLVQDDAERGGSRELAMWKITLL